MLFPKLIHCAKLLFDYIFCRHFKKGETMSQQNEFGLGEIIDQCKEPLIERYPSRFFYVKLGELKEKSIHFIVRKKRKTF